MQSESFSKVKEALCSSYQNLLCFFSFLFGFGFFPPEFEHNQIFKHLAFFQL